MEMQNSLEKPIEMPEQAARSKTLLYHELLLLGSLFFCIPKTVVWQSDGRNGNKAVRATIGQNVLVFFPSKRQLFQCALDSIIARIFSRAIRYVFFLGVVFGGALVSGYVLQKLVEHFDTVFSRQRFFSGLFSSVFARFFPIEIFWQNFGQHFRTGIFSKNSQNGRFSIAFF